MSSSQSRDRRRGNALLGVAILLLLVALALGGNYVRNYQVDKQEEKNARPYARYGVDDLQVLAEGYRKELATLEARHGGGRVGVRNRHHFSDQVQEFERVQKAARRNRDKAVEIAQIRGDLKEIEEEISRRQSGASGARLHFERMFRI